MISIAVNKTKIRLTIDLDDPVCRPLLQHLGKLLGKKKRRDEEEEVIVALESVPEIDPGG